MGCVNMTQQRTRTTSAVPGASAAALSALGAPGLPAALYFDGDTSYTDALEALALDRFVRGHEPFVHSVHLQAVRDEATLLPPGVTPTRSVYADGSQAHLATGDGWTIYSVRWRTGSGTVSVTATSAELAESIAALATEGAEPDLEPDDEQVEIGFWHQTAHGPRRRPQSIVAPKWTEIRSNYSSRVAAAIDQLVALDADEINGRILLVHGAPGTGKTTALRALAREWHAWCQVDFVLDPEALFSQPGYLIEVVMGLGENAKRPWRMLLLEDCDELVRGGAKQLTGQALSRLLNLTDGLLGQGRQVIVAITTNEDVARLHPAITRPGRCLGQVEVGPLPYDEAVAWLGKADGIGPGGATLAQLLALRDGTGPVATVDPEPVSGMYL